MFLDLIKNQKLIQTRRLIKKKKIMTDKQRGRITFQTSKHHKQILRSQIDPRLVDAIQIDHNPSLNYMNAYKNLFHDELQKTVSLQREKKQKQLQLQQEDKIMLTGGMKEEERSIMNDGPNLSSSKLSKYGQRYVDYDQEKTMKCQDHIKKNYDGGKGFYKAHDQHVQRKQQQALATNKTLTNQIQFHEFLKQIETDKKNQQNQAFRELKYQQWLQQVQKYKKEKIDQRTFRQDIIHQIQQEKERKQHKTSFYYQNAARHNPITNPIQYHIDNPYILKQIQARSSFKSTKQQNYRN